MVKFKEDDYTEEFTIVTTIEADPLNNKISIESPLGKVLYKCRAGQEVTVDFPEGKYSVIVEEITKIL